MLRCKSVRSKLDFLGLTAAGAVALLSSYPGGASAANTNCVGTLGEITVFGSLTVPTGNHCYLLGTKVTRDVNVSVNAALTAKNARIGGNIDLGPRSRLAAAKST